MSQFLSAFSILILLTAFNPIVCSSSKTLSERRARAIFIHSGENNLQHLGDRIKNRAQTVAARNNDELTNKANNAQSDQKTKDSILAQNIRNLFATAFEPGLHLFNTDPFVKSQKHHSSNGLDVKKVTSTPNKNGEEPHITDCLEEDELNNNKTYCSNHRKYPEKNHLEELIEKKFTNFEALFGEDLIVPEAIDQRMGNDPNEESFCRSRQVVIYPQSGQNKDYKWLYIVNSDKFKQGIRIEECLDPCRECGQHVGLTLPANYATSCEQHFIYRTLVAYDENNDSIFKETFRLPAWCKCVLRNKLNIN